MDAYDVYLEEVPGDTLALNRKHGSELALRWTPDSSRYVVENFKPANTPKNDWAPMVASTRDNVLFFASDREGGASKRIYDGTLNNWSDMWYLERKSKTKGKEKEKWDKPLFLEQASTKWNEGGIAFDSKFSEMFMTQCGGPDGKTEKCLIYRMKKVGKDWSMTDPLDFCKDDTAHNYGHPALSPDGSQLFFASDREGGLGGFDIYVVNYSKRSKTWGAPVNLGPNINTAGNEYYPYLNNHDSKLYFASDGFPGVGGLDIFKAKATDDITSWKKVENLKEPINSGGDDFGITFNNMDANSGYFTSNRGDRKHNFDIYSFKIEPCSIVLSGVVADCKSKLPLELATVTITNNTDTVKKIIKTNSLGQYGPIIINPDYVYEIDVKYPEKYYFPAQPQTVSTMDQECGAHIRDFCLESPFDKLFTLPIFYDLDKDFIRPDAAKILDDFAQSIMIRYPLLIAELGSHTDCRATMDYNVDLAQRRAKNAVDYLVKVWKIDSARILAKGYGEAQLTNDCKCEGSEIQGYTPYVRYDENNEPFFAQKAMVIKDEGGNVVKSFYEDYLPSEVKLIEGKQFVECNEYQHQQNRRTTVRFSTAGIESRVKVNQTGDKNNRNTKDSLKKPGTPVKPVLDESNAVRVRVFKEGSNSLISAMINETESSKFAFDMNGKYTAVPAEVAAEWFTKKMINKGSFQDGEGKIKVNGVKLPSNKFYVDKLDIGGYVIEKVLFVITDKVEVPTLGKSVFKVFKTESYEKDGELVLIPKKAVKKPKEPKK